MDLIRDETGEKPGATAAPFPINPAISAPGVGGFQDLLLFFTGGAIFAIGGKLPGIFTANAASSFLPFFRETIPLSGGGLISGPS